MQINARKTQILSAVSHIFFTARLGGRSSDIRRYCGSASSSASIGRLVSVSWDRRFGRIRDRRVSGSWDRRFGRIRGRLGTRFFCDNVIDDSISGWRKNNIIVFRKLAAALGTF